MVSAVKVDGRRLHELARAGQEIERDARRVRVDRLDLEAFEPGPYPLATLYMECSTGTYVRTLAADLGTALGGCAHVECLRRLRVGSFGLEEAHPLDEIESDPAAVALSPLEAMRELERLDVDDETARAVCHGMTFPAGALGEQGDGPFAVVGPADVLLGVYERRRAGIKPAVIVASPAA
jgi:tRNA pseudouridine55 synthase